MEIFADPELWSLIGLFVLYFFLSLVWVACAATINLSEEGFSFPKWNWKQKALLVFDLTASLICIGTAMFYFVVATAYLGSLL